MTSWPSELAADATVVRRLHIRGSGLERVAVQHQAAAALNAARLGEAGLPALAILCIRTFRDPLPGTLRLTGSGPNSNARWQRAAAKSLASFVRHAARPVSEPVPADSEAVLFLDPGEMLASLARDWCAGTAATHWWWKSLCPRADIGSAVLRIWRDGVEYAPSAMQQLAIQGRAAPFVHALGSASSRRLLSDIIQKFGLATMVSFVQAPTIMRTDEVLVSLQGSATSVPKKVRLQARQPLPPPWRCRVAAHEEGGAAGDCLLLLVTALLLERSPAVIRAPEFAEHVRIWLSASGAEEETDERVQPKAASTEPLDARPLVIGPLQTGQSRAEGVSLVPVSAEEANAIEVLGAPAPPPLQEASGQDRSPPGDLTLIANGPIARRPTQLETSRNQPETFGVEGPRLTPPASITTAAETVELVETEFGGIFYLINLGIYLNLYGDFTTPLRAGLALPVWDFIALVGRSLAGERLQTDRVWKLLAQLSGRDDRTEPADGFPAPQDWRKPEDWAEFLGSVEMSLAIEPGGSVIEWLQWLMPYMQWRLLRALGIGDSHVMARAVCERSARIRVTPTRVDVTFSLASLPVEVRLSGLDRNPGWVPAAGRFIEFHYD